MVKRQPKEEILKLIETLPNIKLESVSWEKFNWVIILVKL